MKINLIDYQKPTIEVLFTNRKYRVPKFQRPFSWNKDKAEKFWDDIFNEEEDYFMGTIVLSKRNGCFEIIDGQQRITTISLFFLALYLFYKKAVSEGDAKSYIYKYLKSGTLRDNYHVLSLSKKNENFYSNLLDIPSLESLDSMTTDSNSNQDILSIVKLFIGKLNEKKSDDKNLEKSRLTDILEKVEKCVFFIEINVPDYKQASKLFEVLNNRGTDLTKADLVRNYLLSEVERQKFPPEVTETWENIEENVGTDNLEKFIRYSSLLMSSKYDLYERVIVFTEATSSKTSIDLLKELSLIYKKIIDPTSFAENETESCLLNELSILGVTQSHSVLLAGYYKYNEEDVKKLLRFLINFTFRYSSVCGENPNKLEKKYAGLAYRIYNEKLSFEKLKKEIIELNPTDNDFEENFNRKEFKKAKIPRYILGKIENFISSEEKIINFSAVHLEHIMPKKIDKWIESDPSYLDTYEKYIDNIGNMTLLSKKINTAIKNSLFIDKKEKYDESEINLVKEIKTKKEWKGEEITWNIERYLKSAKEIWKI